MTKRKQLSSDYEFSTEDENDFDPNDSTDSFYSNSDLKDSNSDEQINILKDELASLEEGIHPGYNIKLQRIETAFNDRKFKNQVIYDFKKDEIQEEYIKEIESSERDLTDEKTKIMERLLSELEEKKRMLNAEKNNVDLTFSGDVLEMRPTVKRILRRNRGANDSNQEFSSGVSFMDNNLSLAEGGLKGSSTAAVLSSITTSPGHLNLSAQINERSGTKKRKQCSSNGFHPLQTLLNETDVYADLHQIQRACGKVSSRKLLGSTSGSQNSEEKGNKGVWIDDGRLYYGHKCYITGTQVSVDGKEGPGQRCTGVITTVGLQDITVKRSSDSGAFKISIQQLRNGKYSLQRRS